MKAFIEPRRIAFQICYVWTQEVIFVSELLVCSS